jgi:hypothetical protein
MIEITTPFKFGTQESEKIPIFKLAYPLRMIIDPALKAELMKKHYFKIIVSSLLLKKGF